MANCANGPHWPIAAVASRMAVAISGSAMVLSLPGQCLQRAWLVYPAVFTQLVYFSQHFQKNSDFCLLKKAISKIWAESCRFSIIKLMKLLLLK